MLSDGFSVVTRFQNAMGRSKLPRYYAFVFVQGQGTKAPTDLAGILLSEGLARLHGVKASPPSGQSISEMAQKYEEMEMKAKTGGIGAWGRGGSIRTGQR